MAQAGQPRGAVVVVQGHAGGHFRDVGGGVEIVGIIKGASVFRGQQCSDAGLSGTGDSHDDDDSWFRHEAIVCGAAWMFKYELGIAVPHGIRLTLREMENPDPLVFS